MGRVTFRPQGKRHEVRRTPSSPSGKAAADIVRELKTDRPDDRWGYYRERSLALHGPICARCGREFAGAQLRLLTVHHKDGNHHNNPPDGSNWENLCVYCHEDAHSRELLADFYGGEGEREQATVYGDGEARQGLTSLGEILQQKLAKKGG